MVWLEIIARELLMLVVIEVTGVRSRTVPGSMPTP
jgi:hypothetical protein